MTDLRVTLTGVILADVEEFLTDRGTLGLEGTGLIACTANGGGGWVSSRFIAPDQHARRQHGGCSVEVTDAGKDELVRTLGRDELYLVRVHSHPGDAFHSPTDDRNPALTHEGALSVVVPYFGLGMRRGLGACAVYRLTHRRWVALPPGPTRTEWLSVNV